MPVYQQRIAVMYELNRKTSPGADGIGRSQQWQRIRVAVMSKRWSRPQSSTQLGCMQQVPEDRAVCRLVIGGNKVLLWGGKASILGPPVSLVKLSSAFCPSVLVSPKLSWLPISDAGVRSPAIVGDGNATRSRSGVRALNVHMHYSAISNPPVPVPECQLIQTSTYVQGPCISSS